MNRLPRLTWQVTVQSPHGAPPAPVSVTRKAKAADGDLETRRGAPEKPTATSPAAEQSGGSAAARDAGAEVVVLRRRQDGKETKRQEQVLLNNVIEETASRLVAEARKSKVKALVGAFETVISLQETGKAAAPVAAASVAP